MGEPLVWVDAEFDRERASNRRSRYKTYLDQHARDFDDAIESGDIVAFTTTAWWIATGPIMSPGYARHHDHVAAITASRAETDDDALLVDIEVPLHQTALAARRELRGWADWDTDYGSRTLHEPRDQAAILTTTHLWCPIPAGHLHVPARSQRAGRLDVDDAHQAIARLVEAINTSTLPAAVSALVG